MSTTGFRKILHDPEDAKLDIVFVHGLNGDRTTTWEKDGILWPKDILPKDLGRARILSWGYSAKVLDFWQISGKHGLNEHSEQLVADMADKRDEVVSPFIPKCEKNTASIRGLTKGAKGDRPIIFVAHSLGGLVCKNGLVFAAGHAEPHYKSIADHTRGIIFLGTPHGGSDQVKWATRGATFAKMFNMSVDDGILKIFREGSSKLIEVDDNFMNFLRDRNESEDSELGKVKVTCFFEELPMPVIGQVGPQSPAS
ncbi:hypothetical protein FQN49_001589 [Arthroderma sp. PD_2]|nr:hypothetical protein FQN49_001589 [Arthroderma sp. PD_2]